MRKQGKLIASLLVASMLAGCGSYRELDETAYVFTLTADKSPNNRLKIGMSIPVPRLIGKIQGGAVGVGGGPGQEPYDNTAMNVPTISEAITMVQLYAGREISLEHVKALIVSEELARESMEQVVRPLIRNPELRSTVDLFISHGDASRLAFENQSPLEVNVSKFVDLVSRLESVHGLSSTIDLGEFYDALVTDGSAVAPLVALNEQVLAANKAAQREQAGGAPAPDAAAEQDKKKKQDLGKPKEKKSALPPARLPGSYLPGNLPREGGNPLEFVGLAVFSSGKMVGTLNGYGALVYNLLTGSFKSARVTFSDPHHEDMPVTVRIYQGRYPNIKVDISGSHPKIQIQLVVDCDLESVPSGEALDTIEALMEIQSLVSAQVQRWVKETIADTQKWGADIFSFNQLTRKYFLTWNAWRGYDWQKEYKNAEIEVKTITNVRRPGLIMGSARSHQ